MAAGAKRISISSGDLYMKSNYQDFDRFTLVDIAIAVPDPAIDLVPGTIAGIGAFSVPTRLRQDVEGRRVLLVDDVIATGGTAHAASRLLERAGARVTAAATVLLKGPEPDLPRLVVLARPLL